MIIKHRLLTVFALLCWAGYAYSALHYFAEIPYRMIGGKMTADVVVNGKPGRFIFDTGAPVSLTNSFAADLDLPKIGSVPMIDSNGHIFENAVTVIDSFGAGGVNFKGPQALIMGPGNPMEQFGVDGIIGYTLFADKVVSIDTERKVICIAPDTSFFKVDIKDRIPLLENSFVPQFEIDLNGQPDTVMLDTGASNFYDLSMNTYERLCDTGAWELLARGKGSISVGATGLEASSLKYRVKIPSFKVGNTEFTNVTTKTTSGHMSRLGADFLSTGTIIIDYPNGALYFNAADNYRADRYEPEWNVVITAANGQLKAGLIWEDMWGQLEGGEQVVEINGQRFDNIDAWTAMTKGIAGLSGQSADITVIDVNGIEKKLIIKRQ